MRSERPLARWRDAAVALLFVALAVLMTWPLARVLDRAVSDPGDPYINSWILDWDYYATLHHPLSLFNANAFYPARYSLAFSENLYGIALLLIPFRLAGLSALAAYNLAMVAGFAFSGFAAYLLGKKVTGSAAAGLPAGVFYAFLPFRFTHLSHVQFAWGGWLPMLLLALLHYFEEPSKKRAALFGLIFLFNGLTNIHWLLFGSFAGALTAALLMVQRLWRDRAGRTWGEVARSLVPLLVATLVASCCLLPILWPYLEASRLYGMVRSWHECKEYSAAPADWLVSNFSNHLYEPLARTDRNPELWLFPGFLSLSCGVLGLFAAWRMDRKTLAVALLWLTLGFIGSLGLHTFFHRFLFMHVQPFRAVRVPARWASVAYVALAMLIAGAVRWTPEKWRTLAALVLAAGFGFELWSAPVRWYMVVKEPNPIYTWLKDAQFQGAVLEVPFGEQNREYEYLLRSTIHHRPLLNGVSGFTPPSYAGLAAVLNASPVPATAITQLRAMNCGLIVAHGDYCTPHWRGWLTRELRAGRIHFLRRFDAGSASDWLFTLDPRVRDRHSEDLTTFLGGGTVYTRNAFGLMDAPIIMPSGTARIFNGWAMSSYGIDKVDLLFQNGGVRLPTKPLRDRELAGFFPWYPVPFPRFQAAVEKRPEGVAVHTDVQVEITDGRGVRTLLEDRWFDWPEVRKP